MYFILFRKRGLGICISVSRSFMKLNELAFAYASAIFGGVWIFLMMVYSLLTGRASDLMTRAASLHWASYSWGGAFLMAIEHIIAWFILGWVFAWLYNIFIKD